MFRRLLCKLGIHKRETISIAVMMSIAGRETKPELLYYSVCKYCGEGHPDITGEW